MLSGELGLVWLLVYQPITLLCSHQDCNLCKSAQSWNYGHDNKGYLLGIYIPITLCMQLPLGEIKLVLRQSKVGVWKMNEWKALVLAC